MKTMVSESGFMQAFKDCGRDNQFSYDALRALYDWLEQLGEDCGEEIELDVIALCCEYTEYKNLEEFQENYNADEYETIEDVENATTVIPVTGDSFIIQDF